MKQQKNNTDYIDNMLYDYFANTKDIPDETAEVIKNALHKKSFKHNKILQAVASVITVSILTTSIVFAKDIAKFLGEIFNLSSINIQNDSIVDAINNDYIQNVDMDYIVINDNYKIKVDYLMLDDINLYILFNLYSDTDIPENYELSIWDLVITDNNNNCLHVADAGIDDLSGFVSVSGWHNISTTSHEIKELFFLETNGIPDSENLNIKFTSIDIYNKSNPRIDHININCNTNFDINLIEKFKNRETIKYELISSTNNECKIDKCIATDTGLYLVYKTHNPAIRFELLSTKVSSDSYVIGPMLSTGECLIITQFNISKEEIMKYDKIKFSTNNQTIELKQSI